VHRKWFGNGIQPARLTLGESIRGAIYWPCRDELLNIELFASLQEVKILAEQYRIEYIVFSTLFCSHKNWSSKGGHVKPASVVKVVWAIVSPSTWV